MRRHLPWLVATLVSVAVLTYLLRSQPAAGTAHLRPVVALAGDVTDPRRPLTADQLKVIGLPDNLVPSNAIVDPRQATGRYLRMPLPANTPLRLDLLLAVSDARLSCLAWLKRPEDRCIGVPIDLPGSVGAQLAPGGHIDLTAVYDPGKLGPAAADLTLARTTWTDLVVAAVITASGHPAPQDGVADPGAPAASTVPVTLNLVVRADQVESLAFASHFAKLVATLRPPDATSPPNPGYRGPLAESAATEAGQPAPPAH